MDGTHSPEEDPAQSPQKLNASLNELVKHFPKTSIDDLEIVSDDEMVDMVSRREKSEYVSILLEKAESLLEPAPITSDFRDQILSELRSTARLGITSSGGQLYLLFFLDQDVPGSGGIFDPVRAAELERIGIDHQAQILGSASKVIGNLIGEERATRAYKLGLQKIDVWKQHFREQYQQEII